jgi:uncharacterized repeat protein (TIGR03803 family)
MKRHFLLLRHSFFSLFLLLLTLTAMSVVSQRAAAATEQTLYNFNPMQSGSLPDGGVVADAAGNLYGVTVNGGAFGHGTVFEFSNEQGGWDHKILYNFTDGDDGGDPEGGVIFDGQGNLYGMTLYGGPSDSGTVFELEHHSDGTWTEKVLHHIVAEYSRFLYGLVFDSVGNLYGTLESGGQFDGGVVFELSPTSSGEWNQTILYNFGGIRHYGNGTDPVGRLIIDEDGNLFGVTFGGGTGCVGEGCGTVYELSPTTSGEWKETILYEFTGQEDGEYPDGALIFDGEGNLYGTASRGGPRISCQCGNVFELVPQGNGGWAHRILYIFQGGSDGANPEFPLIFDSAGNLYGSTTDGGGAPSCGTTGCGTVYELSPNGSGGWNEKVLASFDPTTTGYALSSGVFQNAAGQLFGEGWEGATSAEAGFVYSLTPASGQWNYSALSNFTYTDGVFPEASLVANSKGYLYGTTEFGGSLNMGSVFELKPSSTGSWTESVIYNFSAGHEVGGSFAPTAQPSSLIVDSAGNLYGEAVGGGSKNDGMVYKLSAQLDGSWQLTTLYSFLGGVGGTSPYGGLVMDSAGNLYGTTEYGGKGTIQGQRPTGYGIVFELSPGANGVWTEKTLYEFGGYPSDGALSVASLIFDSAGNLYGTTSEGGSGSCATLDGTVIGCGMVFELSSEDGVWSESVLHSFQDGTEDGQDPLAGLVFDKSGNLFGTTALGGSGSSGGSSSAGTVFELSPSAGGAWKENLIVQFPGPNGESGPVGNLILDASGNLYSTTENYGGSVFELSPTSGGGWNYNMLYAFAVGSGPVAGLIFGPNGYLYGTSGYGGFENCGFVFAIMP